ncbi:MAG: hypothetical protein AB7E72_18655 [Lysobacterales bacterium]
MNQAPRICRTTGMTLALALLLAGCESVEFQSPPSWPLAECDTSLVGDWRVQDLQNSDSNEGEQYLRVSSDCEHWHTIGLDKDENGELKPDVDDIEDDMTLGIARTDQRSYIVALEHPEKNADTDPASAPTGYILIAYEFVEDALILQQIDPKATAHRIIDGDIPGWVDKHDRNPDGSRRAYGAEFSVFVFGSSEEVRTTLEQHDLRGPPWMSLRRVDAATSKRIDEWMKPAP